MNTKVDFFFEKKGQWQEAFVLLRSIVLDCGLTEELKWGHPCYTLDGKNIVLLHGFKDYCALLFFKGALMKDPKGLLIQQTENVQAARQIRFTEAKEIVKLKATLKSYVREALAVEQSGAKVALKKTTAFPVPEELKEKFKAMPELKKAFQALTPGRQRAYLLHFSSPKQTATRTSRIEKSVKPILEGKGLND